ncbi:polysaccharide deacetylase family protein [Spirosoma sp. KCTC 42546]|uniref:polysaccharide deacetylase family protein n=1 Tax=Spirosoma sp. KCTC 42546 TaxID=2520506 RepID=UPI001157B12C|nr:polysaccharide deacetylase family protein [Spirosoma sp. KCTC 42546]QDK81076.1 polysaccharide deacetylase family protein [Spirosoma sp. KCTC 42546]
MKAFVEKIYRKIRYPLNDFICTVGGKDQLLRYVSGKRIMVYHGVDAVGLQDFNSRFISEYSFEQQIRYYKENFNIVPLKEYYESTLPTDRLTIALTFDDGYKNNYTRVLPILEKYQVPATFFVTAIREKGYDYLWTDFYDMLRFKARRLVFKGESYSQNQHRVFYSQKKADPLHLELRKLPFCEIEEFMQEMEAQLGLKMSDFPEDYYLQMTEGQIAAMAKSPYATIGSHTHTHADLTRRPLDEVIEEMRFSKQWLTRITNTEIDSFAFPYGLYNLDVVKAANELGYRRQLPGNLNCESDEQIPELQKRFGNNPFLSVNNQIWCLLNERYL